jgi:hypothetical protein
MFVLVFNETNIVNDGENNKLVFRFPNSTNLTNKQIAVSSISMYYSWFNITSAFQNNILTYTWTSGTTTTTYTINIPDGLYQVDAINNYCQYVMIQNNTYWTDAGGDNYYPFDIISNANRYAYQINTYLIPTSLPVGDSIPIGFVGFPTTTQNSVITIPANFNKILGYTAGFSTNPNTGDAYNPPSPTNSNNYVDKSGNGTLSYLSNISPQVQPNNNILFSLSNISNPYTQPSSIIYSLNPNVDIGKQIIEKPPNFMWNKMIDGTYNELRLTLLGNNLQPIKIQDPNMTILLTIKDNDERL